MALRDEYEALINRMRTSELDAVKEANTLFASDDMLTLIDKLKEYRDQTIPGGHYDQIISGTITVLEGNRKMAETAIEAEAKAQEPQPVYEDPTVVDATGSGEPA